MDTHTHDKTKQQPFQMTVKNATFDAINRLFDAKAAAKFTKSHEISIQMAGGILVMPLPSNNQPPPREGVIDIRSPSPGSTQHKLIIIFMQFHVKCLKHPRAARIREHYRKKNETKKCNKFHSVAISIVHLLVLPIFMRLHDRIFDTLFFSCFFLSLSLDCYL